MPPFTKAFIHIGNSYMFVWCSSRSSSTAAAVAAARSQRALVEREAMELRALFRFTMEAVHCACRYWRLAGSQKYLKATRIMPGTSCVTQ